MDRISSDLASTCTLFAESLAARAGFMVLAADLVSMVVQRRSTRQARRLPMYTTPMQPFCWGFLTAATRAAIHSAERP